jgi:hypothetical protein
MSTNVSRLQVSGHEATQTQWLKICSRRDTMHFASCASKLGQILVTYPAEPAQSAQDFRNPKSEVRNPKQVKNSNAEISKRSKGPVFFFGCFDFSSIVSDCLMSACGLGTGFEIRVSRRYA